MFLRSVLELCGVGVADSGEYSCVAKSGVEKDVATFDLCIVGEFSLKCKPVLNCSVDPSLLIEALNLLSLQSLLAFL